MKYNKKMEQPIFFADTSDPDKIDKMMKLGIFKGITTNPEIVRRETGSVNLIKYYKDLVKNFPRVPVSIQLPNGDAIDLIKLAQQWSKIGKNIVIKVPLFSDNKGLIITRKLLESGIKVNVTALMDKKQVLLAAVAGMVKEKNGPDYLSIFYRRIADYGRNPVKEIKASREFIDRFRFRSKLIIGSIRNGNDVYNSLMAGAHIVTITPKVFDEMQKHLKTNEFIDQSQAAWHKLTDLKKSKQ